MTVETMTLKERVIEHVEEMDEATLLKFVQELDEAKKQARLERQLKALEEIAGIITDPEEIEALEQAVQRRPFFGDRKLDIEP